MAAAIWHLTCNNIILSGKQMDALVQINIIYIYLAIQDKIYIGEK